MLMDETLHPEPYAGYVRGVHVARFRVEDRVPGNQNRYTPTPKFSPHPEQMPRLAVL